MENIATFKTVIYNVHMRTLILLVTWKNKIKRNGNNRILQPYFHVQTTKNIVYFTNKDEPEMPANYFHSFAKYFRLRMGRQGYLYGRYNEV